MPRSRRSRTFLLRDVAYQRGHVDQGTSIGASAVSLQVPDWASYRPLRMTLEVVTEDQPCTVQVETFEGTQSNSKLWSVTTLMAAHSRRAFRYSYPRREWLTGSEKSQNLVELDHPCINMEVARKFHYLLMVEFEYQRPTLSDTCPSNLVNGTFRDRAL